MRAALARHDDALRSAIEAHRGYVFSTGGDGFAAAFSRAGDAVAAALDAQAALTDPEWPTPSLLRVRMGLHTGEVEERDGDYFGPAVNRAARIMAAGHGGQVLVSAATAAVAGGAGLVDLGEHTFAGLAAPERVFQLGPAHFPPLRSIGSVPSNLPVDLSVFVGRERELASVAGLLRSARVVTLTGVGGVGKTRLAVQVAGGMMDEFPGGAFFVELAPLIDPALVASTVASSVGAAPSPGADPTEVVCRFLAQRRALIVLDNCEHVIDAAAALAGRLVSAAPRARVLATSREPLNVKGESAWRVPSLTIEEDGVPGDAVALFMERVGEARPGFALDNAAHRDAVVQVCRRLDGIPLAIELAAARARMMSVEQLASRLDERFRLLTRGGRGAVPRQQTLEGAIEWSYELLAPAEQALFDVLGVFAGEFDLAAVAAVAALDEFEALDLLGQLADKSMLEADPGRDRYRLLETLRQYAWGRLVATQRLARTRDAHAAYYANLAGEQAGLMTAPGRQVEALDRLELDYDNLRAALAYLIEQRQADAAARMARRLVGLFNIRHPREGLDWFRQVLAIAEGLPAKTRGRLLGDAAFAALNAGAEVQLQYAQASVDLAGDDAPAIAHWVLASYAMLSDSPDAVQKARRAVAIAAATNDLTTQLGATGTLAEALALAGAEPEARTRIAEVIGLAEGLGSPTMTTAAYTLAGDALACLGYAREAVKMYEEGLARAESSGPLITSRLRTRYILEGGDQSKAIQLLLVDLPVAKQQLSGINQLFPLVAAAKVLADTNPSLAAALLATPANPHERSNLFETWREAKFRDRLVEQLRHTLGDARLDEELRRGSQLTPEQALQLAVDALGEVRQNR
jgi:predicted ATPase